MPNLLFVCSENRLRSATAEAVFCGCGDVEAIGAGTNADAATVVSGDLIEWADVIFAMETSHRDKIVRRYRQLLRRKRLVVLDVPDDFAYMDPRLVALLKARVARHVQL
ncbi:MAG: phosphotyrosine protein phosphatase [Chromatiales bacterium]|nr:phosphotyrosine protein phosphatase [Chromatiales bacterium]